MVRHMTFNLRNTTRSRGNKNMTHIGCFVKWGSNRREMILKPYVTVVRQHHDITSQAWSLYNGMQEASLDSV